MNSHLNDYLEYFEKKLISSVSFHFNDTRQSLESAIQYSVTSGGKRIRPLICMACESIVQPSPIIAPILGVAIELIHCYSLIHDDLPAMDNDDFRRGKPTCHKAHSEALAILAGDAINTYVFEYLSTKLPNHLSYKQTIAIIERLAHGCGINGMAGGQAMDITHTNQPNQTKETLATIHRLKTGSLLRLCFELPMVGSDLSPNKTPTMTNLGHAFGMLFQIIDDILDETASFEEIGKSPGKDRHQNKLTYPMLYGLDGALAEATAYYDKCMRIVASLPQTTHDIQTIIEYIYKKGVSSIE